MKILFVCLGNICRSPLLHHLMHLKLKERGLEEEIFVDSCAISSWNLGEDMNPKMRRVAAKHGYEFGSHKAKLFQEEMLEEYDYIFVVTQEILEHIRGSANEEEAKKILMATHFSDEHAKEEIPDPYYGEEDLFERVFHMMHTVITELIDKIEAKVLPSK